MAQPHAHRPPVIGIGASAGGIDAVSQLLRRVPADAGIAFVVIQQLAPPRSSHLSAVLARTTAMTVVEAEDGARPEANHVYVVPPGVEIALRDGRLALAASERARRPPRSIDVFFRSLADERRGQAIAVLLSGTGSDGTEGLRAIRAQGGIALVEELGVDQLADELVELSLLAEIFALVRGASGVDYSQYEAITGGSAAVVDERLDVIHLRGQTAPFLELGPGHPNLGILKLARTGLKPALRSALAQARKEMTTVRREGVEIRDGDRVLQVAIEVIPLSAGPARERHFLVLFQQAEPAPVRREARPRGQEVNQLNSDVADLMASFDRAGRWHRMQLRPRRTVDGKRGGAVISMTDIDRLKQAAGHATAALDQMSAILDTIRVPLVVLDESFAVRSANPAYYDAYGGDPSQTVGQLWFETCDRAWDSPALRDALAAALAGEGDAVLEIELECPPESARTIEVSASVLRWTSDAPLILITSVDVTERIRLVEKAEEARSQAVRASSSKDVFLATLSHELRGPLHTIALHTDLLLAGAAGDPDRARGAGQAIARAAEGLERIIADLLDVSAIVAGKVSLKRKPVDLRVVINAALDAVRSAAAQKRVDLSFEPDGETTVVGDETRLLQVVGNLVGNAVKFTPTGGKVAVELEQTDGIARIRVVDSGQGIAPEFLPHVFDRFVQADGSNARAHGGLGLGLAIVRDLVRLHGGSVLAESDGLGAGAAFSVELPAAARRPAPLDADGEEDTDPSGYHRIAIGAATGAAAADLGGLRVLLVDDDAGSRQVLSEMLSTRGARVRAVPSASAALAALGEAVPDVLLCDIVMPDEDGYSLIQRIRSLPATQGGQVPAVAVTALATRGDRKRALAAGFQLHVAKPAPVTALCNALRRARG